MPKCGYSKYCGGCYNLDKDYNEILNNKTQEIRELFDGIYNKEIPQCIGNYYPLKYRNKVHLAFTELKGKTLIGFFEENSSKVTDINSCLLFGDWLNKLILILREFVSRFHIKPYGKEGIGVLRFAHARCIDNKLQLTLVVTTENFAGREWLYHKLSESFNDVSLYININRRTDNAVFGDKFKFVKGSKFLTFNMCNVKVSIAPNSFLQVNQNIAEKMYRKAVELLDIEPNTTVLDLYSGIGITSILFSKIAKQVFSIEEVASSVENAKYMAKLNDCHNINIMLGKCENTLNKIDLNNIEDLVVFCDPARMGIDNKLIDAIKRLNPRKIVYMSCNPETCVRDIKLITNDNNYNISDISCWDMFPFTKHIELLTCLQKD